MSRGLAPEEVAGLREECHRARGRSQLLKMDPAFVLRLIDLALTPPAPTPPAPTPHAPTLLLLADDFDRRATTSEVMADKALDPNNRSGTSFTRAENHRADAQRFRDEAERLRAAAKGGAL